MSVLLALTVKLGVKKHNEELYNICYSKLKRMVCDVCPGFHLYLSDVVGSTILCAECYGVNYFVVDVVRLIIFCAGCSGIGYSFC
jgi:hypothetical protein